MEITLIIPAKNESESLPKVLNELKKFQFKIIVILRNEDQATIQSISNYNIKIVFQDGFGYGDALIKGINSVETKLFCIFNADGSFDPKEINDMYYKLTNNNFDFISYGSINYIVGSQNISSSCFQWKELTRWYLF